MTCLASCAVGTTGRRADRSARNSRIRFPTIGVTLRLKPLTLHGPRRILAQELLTRPKRNIKLTGQSNVSINGWAAGKNVRPTETSTKSKQYEILQPEAHADSLNSGFVRPIRRLPSCRTDRSTAFRASRSGHHRSGRL